MIFCKNKKKTTVKNWETFWPQLTGQYSACVLDNLGVAHFVRHAVNAKQWAITQLKFKSRQERNKLPWLTCLPFIDGSPQVLQPSLEVAEPVEIFEPIFRVKLSPSERTPVRKWSSSFWITLKLSIRWLWAHRRTSCAVVELRKIIEINWNIDWDTRTLRSTAARVLPVREHAFWILTWKLDRKRRFSRSISKYQFSNNYLLSV